MAGLRDAVDLGTSREFLEDRVDGGVAERSEIGNLAAKLDQGIGHDRTVAAQLGLLGDRLDIGAASGCRRDPLAEFRDRPEPIIGMRVVAFVDDVDNFIDESVQPDEGLELGCFREGGKQGGGAGFAKFGGFHHTVAKLIGYGDDLEAISGNTTPNCASRDFSWNPA